MSNMESHKNISDKYIDEIISELNDCREDERNAQNQIVQIIGSAAPCLALFWVLRYLLPGRIHLAPLTKKLLQIIYST